MYPQRWQQVRELFAAARERPDAERAAFLASACRGDVELQDEVGSLLSEADALGGFLATGSPAQGGHLPPEERIGSYRILGVLGRGGMGVVYLAEQENPRRTVALKVIRPGLFSAAAVRRFEHEAAMLARLRHPGIAQIYEAGTAAHALGPRPFFAMELIEGEQLIEFARREELGTRARLELFARVCDGVQHAHQKSVIHRDLKPGNILVDPSGQPKILDFGIARSTDADVLATSATGIGQLLGTLPYMSPEQTSGDPRDLDTRSDVYALGVVLYELLTGVLPHDLSGKSIPEAVRVISERDPTPLSSVNKLFRGDLDTIASKALEKDRARRYASASDLAADVRRTLCDEPISARPASTIYQLRKFARRNRALVGGVGVAFLVLVLGIAGTTWQALRATRLARAETEQRRQVEIEKSRAVESDQRAQRRFEDVVELARTVLYDLDDRIKHLAGATPARQLLVTTALEYLDSLAREAGDDPRFLRELAVAYRKVGDVQGNPNNANLGDFEGALASYEKSLEHARALAASLPGDAGVQRLLAVSQDRSGDALMALDRADEALARWRAALEVHEELALSAPDDYDAQREVVISRMRIGGALEAAGRPADALLTYEEGVELARALREEHPQAVTARSDLALLCGRLGAQLEASGRPEEALERTREAFEILEALAREAPDDAGAQYDLSVVCGRFGSLLAIAGQWDEAVASGRRAVTVAERLSGADPRDAQALTNLASAYGDLAHVHEHTARYAESSPEDRLVHWREARSLYQLSFDAYAGLDTQGILAENLRGELERLERALEECADEIEALGHE